jgi:hypothetical protein
LQSGDEVGQKAGGVVVPLVQRQSSYVPVGIGHPRAKKRAFAEAGRGTDEAQFGVQTIVKALDQARAQDGAGDVKLCG